LLAEVQRIVSEEVTEKDISVEERNALLDELREFHVLKQKGV
jgi:hypothetical protein